MKFSTLAENLHQALQHVSRFTASKSQLPILSHILFSSDNGRLKLSATNIEIGINFWLGAKIETDGLFTIPSRDITEYVSYLPSGRLDFYLNDKGLLHLNSPKTQSTFTTSSPNDFPSIPSIDPKSAIGLDSQLFSQAVQNVAFAAATDDSRPILTSVLCHFYSDHVVFVATDGFRLSIKSINLTTASQSDANHSDEITYLIPARSLSEVVRLCKSTKQITLGPTVDNHQIVFLLDDTEIVSRLLEGDFPDYQRIVPESFSTKITLDKDEFAQSVKMASVFARESANIVRFKIKKDTLELSSNAPQIGQNQITIDSKLEGEPLEIAFNFKFINDFLSVVPDKEIIIKLNQPLTPGLFCYPSDPDFTHIIMPVRLQD